MKFPNSITAIVLLLLFISCDIHKESQKTKTESNLQEQIEIKTIRKGDSISFIVPNIIYKDTIIYTVSRQGTVLKTYYDKSGKIYQVDCNSAAIDELRKEIRTLAQSSKNKSKDKTEKVNTQFLLYGAIALVLIFALGLYLLYHLIDKKLSI